MSDFYENPFSESFLNETIISKEAILDNGEISGDLNGTCSLNNFQIVTISSGPFSGKGFYKSDFQAVINGLAFSGEFEGALFTKIDEKKIYLKGSVSGDISATHDGYLIESNPGSGIYDLYIATLKFRHIGDTQASGVIHFSGNLSYEGESVFPSTKLYFLQSNLRTSLQFEYSGPLSMVLSHIRIMAQENPYLGEGFSIISYTSRSGSGMSWSHDTLTSSNQVKLKGLFSSPFFGIFSSTMYKTTIDSLSVERVDLGLPPSHDLKAKIVVQDRVSPGEVVNCIVEYRNDGLLDAESAEVTFWPTSLSTLVSASAGVTYDDSYHIVKWGPIHVPAGGKGYLYLQERIVWKLPNNYYLLNQVGIHGSEEKMTPPAELFEKLYGVDEGRRWMEFLNPVLDLLVNRLPPFFYKDYGKMGIGGLNKTLVPGVEIVNLKYWLFMKTDEANRKYGWNSEHVSFWGEVEFYVKHLPTIRDIDLEKLHEIETKYFPLSKQFGSIKTNTAKDPNIKYGPEGSVLPGQKLDYKIEYENEGEGIAFGVYFTDVIDEDIDVSNLEIGSVMSTADGSIIAPPGTYNPSTRTITWLERWGQEKEAIPSSVLMQKVMPQMVQR